MPLEIRTAVPVLRGAEFRDGAWRDIVIFGLLRDEQLDD